MLKIIMNLFSKIKTITLRNIISNSYFWRFRHWIQPGWVISYSEKNNLYFNKLVKELKINSIMDFGCGAGSTLFNIKEKNNDILVFGIDINQKAIEFCNNRFSIKFENGFFFSNVFKNSEIENYLNSNKIKFFDLIVFDRVLYCLNEKQIYKIFNSLKNKTRYIFIDDFFLSNELKTVGYTHRNWSQIMSGFNFKIIKNNKTIYQQVKNANARTLIYKSNNSYD